MLHSLFSLLIFAGLAVAALGVGRPLLRWIGVGDDDRLTTIAFSLGIGLIAVGLILLALGFAGAIYVPLIGIVAMAAGFWGMVELGNLVLPADEPLPEELSARHRIDMPAPAPPWPPPPAWLVLALIIAVALVCGISLLAALAPPITETGSAVHLESAKRFLVDQEIADAAAVYRDTGPLLVEMWYLWTLAFEGGACAQLLHWGLGILLALATAALATPLLGRSWAWIAGGLTMLTPAISQQMSLPTKSVALAALSTLALAAWWQAVVHGEGRRWFVVAGVVAGGALAVHGAAGLLAAAIAVSWAWAAFRYVERRGYLLRGGTLAAVVALIVGGVFGLSWRSDCGFGMVACRVSAVALPDHLGIAVLAAAPGVLLVRRLRGLGSVLAVAGVYAMLVFACCGDARLLFPAVPLLSIAAVWLWIELRRFPRPARWAAAGFLGLMLVCGAALSLNRSPDALLVGLGLRDREDYLLRHEGAYSAAAVANELMQRDTHVLSQERHAYYFNCRVTEGDAFDRYVESLPKNADNREMIARLRGAGFTHLLLAEPITKSSTAGDSALDWAVNAGLTLTDYRFRAPNGAVRHYRLLMLR